jgi:hypothetical protein
MKLLVIPDVHNHYEGPEQLIARFPDHHVVFLGDYFDNYNDTPAIAAATAEWLRWSIQRPKRTHLMGNHDLPYRWRYQDCPGYTELKAREVKRIMSADLWGQVQLTSTFTGSHFGLKEEIRPLVLSHAGFTLANLYGVSDPKDVARGGRLEHMREIEPAEHLREIQIQTDLCLVEASAGGQHHWFNRGSRMGERTVGGPFWLDKDEFRGQLRGIDQVVGHTHVRRPSASLVPCRAQPESAVWFIDGAGSFAVTIDPEVTDKGGLKITPIHANGEFLGEPLKLDSSL